MKMIGEAMKILDKKYDFTTNTDYQQIIDSLNLPYHLDGVVFDEFFTLIKYKYGIWDWLKNINNKLKKYN